MADTVTSVVVADADDDSRNLVHLTFAGSAWKVREAVDAAGAIRTVAAEVPDVLVVDVDLPSVGGVATTRVLRQQPRTAAIAVLVLADPARVPEPEALQEAGVDVVLPRPFDAFALLDAVEKVLAGR